MTTPTAGEITVHRCVVHVVRRGGWSWGPAPQDLVQQILDALPALLTAQFEQHLTGEGPPVEITEPVRVNVRLGDLGSSLRGTASASFVIEPAPTADPVPVPVAEADSVPIGLFIEEFLTGEHVVAVSATPAELFGELAERGELAALLALLPDETLRRYVLALFDGVTEEPPEAVTVPLAAELARRLSVPSLPPTHLVELARTLAVSESPEPSVAEAEPRPVNSTPAEVTAGETRTGAALPFLLAGPLARTGYLDAIGPALASVDLLDDAPLFAAALAYKVLGAPERGWRRTAEDDASAAAFAGLDEVPDLSGFARHVRPALPVLDGVLALTLCRGHNPASPLLLRGVDDGLLLVDAEGMFPIAWTPAVAGLLPHWQACGSPPVLVCEGPLPPSCLKDLVTAGVQLVTTVRPLRDDPLIRVPWRTPLWTSGVVNPRLATALPAHTTRLNELVDALFVNRRAIPLAPDRALEHSITLAASLALGMTAWTLWHERETPDPLLTLTRFTDMEATIQYTRDTVRVRLPLGQRHTDLTRSGALADVPNVVWLGGRTLTFSGG